MDSVSRWYLMNAMFWLHSREFVDTNAPGGGSVCWLISDWRSCVKWLQQDLGGFVVMLSLSQDKQTLIIVFVFLGLRSDSRDVYKQPR